MGCSLENSVIVRKLTWNTFNTCVLVSLNYLDKNWDCWMIKSSKYWGKPLNLILSEKQHILTNAIITKIQFQVPDRFFFAVNSTCSLHTQSLHMNLHIRKNIFACLFSAHNTISLSRYVTSWCLLTYCIMNLHV